MVDGGGTKRSRWDDSDEEEGNGHRGADRKVEELDKVEALEPASAAQLPDVPKAHSRAPSTIQACRAADSYEKLAKIDEGTYGIVYRCRERETNDLVALKQVKIHSGTEGFPITALREINILLALDHENIITVREVVVNHSSDTIFMVMDYMEHDLKALMANMKHPFSQSEVKCLMLQLLKATAYMHDHWVIHRDLKTSNLLFSNKGVLTLCDFGMARKYCDPIKEMTAEVVTLFYRAPELLLGSKKYTPAVDVWSIGCIFAEMMLMKPLLPGQGEIDQIERVRATPPRRKAGPQPLTRCAVQIFKLLGTPNEDIWPGYSSLPNAKRINWKTYPYNRLRDTFKTPKFSGGPMLTESGVDLHRMLAYDPERRITAAEALRHPYFLEDPPPKAIALMPTYPAVAAAHAGRGAGPSAGDT